MHLRVFLVRNVVRGLMAFSLILLLVGCDASPQTLPKATATHFQATATSTVTTATPPSSTNIGQAISFDVANLHIYSPAGPQCGESDLYHHVGRDNNSINLYPNNNLVLATDRLTYDSGEVDQIVAYTSAVFNGTQPLPALPNSLSWVSGGPECDLEIQLTNIGDTTIQLQSINLQLLNIPLVNTEHYLLINYCSFPGTDLACPGLAGGGGMIYQFQLGTGKVSAGKIFSPVQPGTFALTLNPNDTQDLELLIDPGQASPQQGIPPASSNLVYSLLPELLVNTQAGQQTISLSKLATAYYFAKFSQFTCYNLHGDTFIPFTLSPDFISGCM